MTERVLYAEILPYGTTTAVLADKTLEVSNLPA